MIARLARAKHNHLPSWLSVQANADELRMGARRQRPMEMALRKSKAEALARRQVEYFFNTQIKKTPVTTKMSPKKGMLMISHNK